MTIPEFARVVKSNNKISAILGDCYDANVILYEMIFPYIDYKEIKIFIDNSQASTGIMKYRISATTENINFSEVKNRYNDMNIDQFNKSFITNTKLTKNNTLIITLKEQRKEL